MYNDRATNSKEKIKELEDCGYYVIKSIKTNKNGIPDILALHPTYGIEFYEVKNKKGKTSKLQEYRLKELKEYGFKAEVTEGEYYYEMDDDFLEDLERLPPLYSAAILMQLDNLAYDIYMEKSSDVKINIMELCRCSAIIKPIIL